MLLVSVATITLSCYTSQHKAILFFNSLSKGLGDRAKMI
ncbi:hypothetical protein [Moraxella phage Mcat12]|nr:hypothetical protein [Moraxella phage Mcat12]